MKFDIVVAADPNWGIGKDNQLPWPSIKKDMAFFRQLTQGNSDDHYETAVIMGRKTWESIPERFRPLPKRLNIVLTRCEQLFHNFIFQLGSLDEALGILAQHRPEFLGVYVIGGAQLYKEALQHPDLRHIYLTCVAKEFDCDTHIPDLTKDFKLDEVLVDGSNEPIPFSIGRWTRA